MTHQTSPKAFGRAIGVSESSVKRWIDDGLIEASRTAGGHRRIAQAEAVRFVRESGLEVIEPHLLGLAELETAPRPGARGQTPDRLLVEALKQGRGAAVRGLILGLYLDGQSVAEICDGPIASAMGEIGEIWAHDERGIFVEHRATDLCMHALNQLRGLLPDPSTDAPSAVGGAPPGDPYVLPSLGLATTLASLGWRAINLGPDTPLDSLVIAADEAGARLVWLSISVEQDAKALARQIDRLAEKLAPRGATLAVGGRMAPASLSLRSGNVHQARTMTELAAFARGLLASDQRGEVGRLAQ